MAHKAQREFCDSVRLKYPEMFKNKKVLDVGAGTGRLSLPLANRGASVTALDVSPKMLELIKKKN